MMTFDPTCDNCRRIIGGGENIYCEACWTERDSVAHQLYEQIGALKGQKMSDRDRKEFVADILRRLRGANMWITVDHLELLLRPVLERWEICRKGKASDAS